MSDCPAHTDKVHRYETRCTCGMKGTLVLSIVAEDERVYVLDHDPAQQERERLRARYEDARSPKAGPYVYEPDDIIIALMDVVIDCLLADPEDDR